MFYYKVNYKNYRNRVEKCSVLALQKLNNFHRSRGREIPIVSNHP